MHRDGCVTIYCDDGKSERLNTAKEVWQSESSTGSAATAQNRQKSSSLDTTHKKVAAETLELMKLYCDFSKKQFLNIKLKALSSLSLTQRMKLKKSTFLKF